MSWVKEDIITVIRLHLFLKIMKIIDEFNEINCWMIEENEWRLAAANHFFHFHQSSLPNGKIDWEMKRNEGHCRPTPKLFLSFHQSIFMKLIDWKRNERIEGRSASAGVEGDEMDWGLCGIGGLWALQRQWLRPKEQTNPNQSINSSSTNERLKWNE